MRLQKGFLRKTEIQVNPWLLVTGLILSAVISFCFYAFFIYISEIFRGTLVIFTNSLLLMEPADVEFYSYTLALLASVIGQGFGLRLIFSGLQRPAVFKSRFGLRQNLLQVKITNWNWLYWVSAWLCHMSYIYTSLGLQYDLNIREELGYLFILLPITWFSIYWLQAHRIFQKDTRLKWISGAFLYLILSTLILGNLHLIDFELKNQGYKNAFPLYKYDINPPGSRTHFTPPRARNGVNIFLFEKDGQILVVPDQLDTGPLSLADSKLPKAIQHFRELFDLNYLFDAPILITADNDIPLSALLALENMLSAEGFRRIVYRTSVENSIYPWHYPPHQNTGVPKSLRWNCTAERQTVDSLKNIGVKAKQIRWPEDICYGVKSLFEENRVLIKSDSNGLKLNNRYMDDQELLNTMVDLIQQFPGNLNVLYQPDPHISFAQYLKGRDLILQSFIINRKRLAQTKYDDEYEYRNSYPPYTKREMYREIEDTYPMALLELTGWYLEYYEYLRE